MTTPARPVVLVGFMGAGKSTVGTRLAARLGVELVDLDRVLEEAWGPLPEQLARGGEAQFRAREAEAVRRWCLAPSGVLATGGGAWIEPASRARLLDAGVTVYLRAPLEVLRERAGGSGRPLWDEHVADRLAARLPLYELAEVHVDAGAPVDDVVASILDALGRAD